METSGPQGSRGLQSWEGKRGTARLCCRVSWVWCPRGVSDGGASCSSHGQPGHHRPSSLLPVPFLWLSKYSLSLPGDPMVPRCFSGSHRRSIPPLVDFTALLVSTASLGHQPTHAVRRSMPSTSQAMVGLRACGVSSAVPSISRVRRFPHLSKVSCCTRNVPRVSEARESDHHHQQQQQQIKRFTMIIF